MLAVAPVVTLERAAGRSGTLSDEGEETDGLEGKGGEEGEGLSKGVSLSSPSGVDAGESAIAEEGGWLSWREWWPAPAGSRSAVRAEDRRRSVAIEKRADSYQVTRPPQRRADGDLAICGR